VRREERIQHDVLGEHPGAALDHDEGVLASRDDEVELALVELRGRRVDDELPADAAEPDGRDGAVPRHVGQRQGR
jgi:hypothetical protein